MTAKKLTCIICPKGCNITVEYDGSNIGRIYGNQCKRGEEYAGSEAINPERWLTTTVKIKGKGRLMLPVRSDKPIPKSVLMECMEEIGKAEAMLPVKAGQVIIEDILGTGANIVASKSVTQ